MHISSKLKVEFFLKHYKDNLPKEVGKSRVLDIGSMSYSDDETYRPLFAADSFQYTGLDIEQGPNVDIVPANGYVWSEIDNESYDLCLSGQTFEHNPFFWVTFAEMARVIAPGGYIMVVAPGAGGIHRFPYDCWRFYPDSWLALCAMTGLKLVESYFESDEMSLIVPGGNNRDSALIAQKPLLEEDDKEAFYSHLASLVAPFEKRAFEVDLPQFEKGPCFSDYEKNVASQYSSMSIKYMKKRFLKRKFIKLENGKSFRGPK